MFNQASFNAVDGSTFSQHFIRPRYDSYCFSNIPATIAWLLSGQGQPTLPLDVLGDLPTRYDQVIFFFVDGFGWRFFERYAEHYPIFKTIAADGVVSKLTSQFPSTTAAHVTSIHTGLDVGQSGVYEWYYYEPLVDEIIMPLRFSFGRDRTTPDTLKRAGIPATSFFPQQTLYQTLQGLGVHSHVFQPQSYAHSTYSQIVFQGAAIHGYTSLQDAFTNLAALLTTPASGPAYSFFYFDRIDSKGHLAGPDSSAFDGAVEEFFTTLNEALYQPVHGKAGKTLLLLSADHGHMHVDPPTTFYLNVQMPELTPLFKTNARGAPIVPAGSPRDMFLYIREEQIGEAIALLQQRLEGKAEIYPTQDLLAQGFFGPHTPSPELLSRVGNVVILPTAQDTVWWLEAGSYDMTFLGHHGGLTPQEMEIPLLALPL